MRKKKRKKEEVYSYPIFLYPGICEVSSGYFETFPREKFFARLPIFPASEVPCPEFGLCFLDFVYPYYRCAGYLVRLLSKYCFNGKKELNGDFWKVSNLI